jgi:hypothetical protein
MLPDIHRLAAAIQLYQVTEGKNRNEKCFCRKIDGIIMEHFLGEPDKKGREITKIAQ